MLIMNMQYILHLLCLINCFILPRGYGNPTCPQTKAGMTNVHFVCHTHDDVGWLKTVDQYYYGSKKEITWVGVQYILDSVLVSLEKDPSRKFIYVESAFFHRWWEEQEISVKDRVKRLVHNGQLEFISGGWSMNDEAAAHYNAIIDQMTFGLRMLTHYFGKEGIPRVAWQIDPFGHSREQASLFAQMGFDGLFFGRLDHDDKKQRWKTKTMEMVWKGSANLGKEAWLFTGVLPRGYSPPKDFCFDLLCADDPIMDDPNLEDYNLNKMVKLFLRRVKEQQEGYATSNLIMTMGEDFDYVNAESWYKNLDKLMKNVNAEQVNGSMVNLMYSTPSCYLDALHSTNTTWPTKEDDFFPYSSDPHAYWTGYFTSRPTLKGYIRHTNNILQVVKQVAALTGSGVQPSLTKLSKAMAVAQHHDAITGTAKQHVTDDYSKRLTSGITDTYKSLSAGFQSMFKGKTTYDFCPLLNITACPFTEESNAGFLVTVYNPLGHIRSSYIRIPVVKTLGYKVTDSEGNYIESQLVPIPDSVLNIPGRESRAQYELVFYAKELPPLGAEQFHIYSSSSLSPLIWQSSRLLKYDDQDDIVIKKGDLWLSLDASTKMLKSVGLNSDENAHMTVNQTWLWYAGAAGDNSEFIKRASGAYIFRPNGTLNEFTNKVTISAIYDGPLVAEIHQAWSPWVSQILRLYKDKPYLEMEWLVGPIPINDGVGKEIVNLVTWGDMKTDNVFYTDSNGREMLKRVKDFRPTWNFNSSEPVSQNYYPVTSRLILSSVNNKGEAALLNDRAQGGTSMVDGQMELMTHRRLLHDDDFGVGEALNETAFGEGLVARGKHYLLHSIFSTPNCDFACQHRTLAQDILLKPLIAFSSSPSDRHTWWSNGNTKQFGITQLPANIHLLTLEPWDKNVWLLRLEHFYEKDESPQFSVPVSVDIQNLFTGWSVKNIKEVTLGGNQWKDQSERLKWRTDDDLQSDEISNNFSKKSSPKNMIFWFNPMQIRSFLLIVRRK